MLVSRATVGPDVCPQPTVGATVRLVYTLSSSLPGVGLTVEWCGPAEHFPCAVVYNWSWWAGPQSDLMSAPSPPLGPQSDWCVPSLPLCYGQDSLWGGVARLGYLHTARLVMLGISRISWGG